VPELITGKKNKMKKLTALILVTLYLFTLSRLSAQGYLMLSGGSGETEGGWSDLPYSKVVEYAANKKIAVISYSVESAWIPDYFKSLGAVYARNFHIPDFQTANSQITYDSLITYDGIFLKGGDQSVYYESYLNSKTQQALQEIFNRGGVLSGTSAGMAIISPVIYTAQGATIYPASAAANPYTSQITLKDDFLATLENPYIFDTHFVQRGRMARLAAFMANWYRKTGQKATGIGVDDRTALFIEPSGIATAYGTAAVNFYFPPGDNPPFDTTVSMLRTGEMLTAQLLHGCTIDLNAIEINGFEAPVIPTLDSEKVYTNLIFNGSDQIPEAALQHFISNTGQTSDTILIVTGSNQTIANALQVSLQMLGANQVYVQQAIASNQNDMNFAGLIKNARKFLFTGNEYNAFMTFMQGNGNGKFLNSKIRSYNTVSFFAGDNARFAGKSTVNNYMENAASYYGELEFSPGLALLETTVIMPNTYLNADIYENTISGLPYAMLLDSLAYGLYLTGNNFATYSIDNQGKSHLKSLGGSIPVILMSNHGCMAGFANQGPNTNNRNVAGFSNMGLWFLAPGDSLQLGTAENFSAPDLMEVSTRVFPNPSKGIIRIELEKGGYELIISSPGGREILKQPFIQETTLDLSSLNNGLYFLIINDISGKRVSAKKILKL
jgi:cyanophycinase-like exopeptidase